MQCIRLKIGLNSKHHKYYKHTKFCQNPRGDPKFLVDLTRNDPLTLWPYSTTMKVGLFCMSGLQAPLGKQSFWALKPIFFLLA